MMDYNEKIEKPLAHQVSNAKCKNKSRDLWRQQKDSLNINIG